MISFPSSMTLHLRYRIWIAEMNNSIDLIRIYNDYLKELKEKNGTAAVNREIERFNETFNVLRSEIDSLRNEMHLLKMKLAALVREEKALDYQLYKADNHPDLKKRYSAFRKRFERAKNDLKNLVKDKMR